MFNPKPYIICELGSNWRDKADITNAVHLVKAMGATALKLQAFTHEALYGFPDGFYYNDPGPGSGAVRCPYISLDWLPDIKGLCDSAGLDLLVTAFSPELVEAVDPFVSAHKIASSDLSYPQLLRAVKKTGKPVLLSTGASSKGDVTQAIDHLDRSNLVLMYCNSAYPSTHHNLFQIDWMRDAWKLPVGLSDHSLDAVYVPLAAQKFHGVEIFEKHFTPIPEVDTPDRPHSLDGTSFKIMCDHLLGRVDTSEFNPSREEKAMMLRHNRRLLATKDISPGEPLVYGKSYGAYRALQDDAHGLSPFLWDHEKFGPEGKRAKVAIKQGCGIGPGDF